MTRAPFLLSKWDVSFVHSTRHRQGTNNGNDEKKKKIHKKQQYNKLAKLNSVSECPDNVDVDARRTGGGGLGWVGLGEGRREG